MKNKSKLISVVSMLLVIAMLISASPIQAIAVEGDSEAIEKVYCTATLEDDFSDNEILIVLMPEYNTATYTAAAFSEIECIDSEELTVGVVPGEPTRIFLLTIPGHSKQNVLEAIKELEKRPDIYSAEPNRTLEMNATPGDPAYTGGQQWAINKIDLPEAWNIATGSYSINVGVVDSGIDRMHSDLYYRVNYDLSWSFLANNRADAFNDVNGHGTKVAGVIGAEGDNDTGMVGACWEIKLVSLKIVDTSEEFDQDNAVKAVQRAETNGISILNFSLAKNVTLPSLKAAIRGYSGLFVCSAGNNNDNIDSNSYQSYPAEYNDLSNLICVGASTSQDRRWSNGTGLLDKGSNYGKTKVDLFAPGANIYTCKAGGGYVTDSGTSFAAPYVAGVAALMLSANPHLSASQLKTKIMDNVEKVYDSSGNDVFAELCKSGGRLNAYYAVNSVTHTHSYTYASCGAVKHEKRCSCGRIAVRENHELVQSGSTIHCTKCNYSVSGWSLN